MAKQNLRGLLHLSASPLNSDDEALLSLQRKGLHEVTYELVKQVTSPNTTVREQVINNDFKVWVGRHYMTLDSSSFTLRV